MTEIEQQIRQTQLRAAFVAVNMAVKQLMQVTRCLTIAQLAIMSDDSAKAMSELAEVNGRLEDVGKHMLQMMKTVEDLSDAG